MACRIEIEKTINKSIDDALPFRFANMSFDGAKKISDDLNDLWGPLAKPTRSSTATYQVNIFGLPAAVDREFAKQKKAEDTFKRDLDFFNQDVALYEQEQQDLEGRLYQEAGSIARTMSMPIKQLQNTVEYKLLTEPNRDLYRKGGQSYIYLSQEDGDRFTSLLERNKEFPKEFKVTKRIVKYDKDPNNPLMFRPYNDYVDYYYIKSNKNKKSNLYDIVNRDTGEVIATKVRVLNISRDAKSKIANSYGLEATPTKVFNANRSIAFALYRQKPSKAKYIAQAKKYLYDAIKFLHPDEKININLDKIEEMLNAYPEAMWDYINTTYSPEDTTTISASTSLQNHINFKLPKLGLITEIEKITGIKLLGESFPNYDRTGALAKATGIPWKEKVTIDQSMRPKALQAAIKYYLQEKGYIKPTSEEENVRKYAEHYGIDYDELRKLVFGDFDKALENIAYNQTSNSDTIELSKWRDSIRNYNWQMAELFAKPYKEFNKRVTERIISKFKDKTLSNGVSHLDYFFSGNFNWLNVNFNNISGSYYAGNPEEEAATSVGVTHKTVGVVSPFVMSTYTKPVAGENFLKESEVFNRLAAILHEPFHALHALSYGTPQEQELRKAFDKLAATDFGANMLQQIFGEGYNNKDVTPDIMYKEFTAFAAQLMLYPKEWIERTDLRSNDIYNFIEKIQTLQDKTYDEVVTTQKKIGNTEKTVSVEEKIKLTFLEKLYNYIVSALHSVIPLSKQFMNLIKDSEIINKTVVDDVFEEKEEVVTRTVPLPESIKKSKEEFLNAMDELKSAMNTLMQIDGEMFSSKNVGEFFKPNESYQQEQGTMLQKRGGPAVTEASPETIALIKEFIKSIGVDIRPLQKIVVNGVAQDADGVAQLMQKLIQVVNGRESFALPEEAMHFAVAIIKQTNPALYKKLMNEINQYKLLTEVFATYGNDPNYQKDGKPDVVKIKEEAIGRVLAEVLIRKAEGLTETSQKLEKVNSWWRQIIEWLKGLFSKSGFDRVALDIINGKEIGTADDIRETADTTFLQKSEQDIIFDKIKAMSDQITLGADNKYHIGDKTIPMRVSDVVKTWYEKIRKDLSVDEYDAAVNDLKKQKGTAGHAAMEYIFHLLVDDDGYLRATPLDDSDFEAKNPEISRKMYDILRPNLEERLKSFGPGARFMSEVTIYNNKSLAGTIDLLVFQPDGTVHILDWKFMDINTDMYTDVPWYKVNEWRRQMEQYRYILQQAYGIKPENFGQTRMIPIQAMYTQRDKNKKIIPSLTGVRIGAVDPKKTNDDYLLPVPLETETTGNERIDRYLEKLNGVYRRISEGKVLPSEKLSKAEQLNQLYKAIRQLQIKNNLKPLLFQARFLNNQINKTIDRYKNEFKGKDPASFDEEAIEKMVGEIETALDEISAYTTLYTDLKSMFEGTLTEEDKKLKEDARDVSEDARDLEDSLSTILGEITSEIIAKRDSIDRYLAPEKVVKGVTKMFASTSTLQLNAIQLLFKKANRAFYYTGIDTQEENKLLMDIKKEYDTWAKSKGLSSKNYFNIIKKQNENELIDQYKPEFYTQMKSHIKNKDQVWIKNNINVAAYREFLKDDLNKRLQEIVDKYADQIKRYTVADQPDSPYVRELKKNMNNEMAKERASHDLSTDESGGWYNYQLIRKYPAESWESVEWKELIKPENAAAKKFYDYIVKRNEVYADLDYIGKGEARVFLPFVRKGLMEKLMLGENLKLGEEFFRSITIDEGDIGYGQIDPLSGRPINVIPKYFTHKFDDEYSEDLFKSMAAYNEAAIRYKYLSGIEKQVRAIISTERSKKAIATSIFGRTIRNKTTGILEYTKDNNENAKLVEDMAKAIVYGQRYIASETFDQLLGKLGDWGEKLNAKLGVHIFPENLTDKQISVNKVIDQMNNMFQLNVLGVNILSAMSNQIGGTMHSIINAGTYFTKTDIIAAEGMVIMNKLNGPDKEKLIGALEYFLPFTDNHNRELAKQLSLHTATEESIQDGLMYFMRQSDWNVQALNFYAYLRNTVVINGQVVNAREYTRKQPKYVDMYKGTEEERNTLKEEFEADVKKLIDENGIMKVAQIVNKRLVIPGVDQKSQSVVELRRKVQQLNKDALGNLSQDDLRMINLTIQGKSFMIFKNWIPRLVDVRMGNMKYNSSYDAYEWGRTRMIMRVLSKGLFSGLANLHNALVANDKGVEFMREFFEQKKADYENDTGKELQMTETEFMDLVRKNIRSQLIDCIFLLTIFSMILALKAIPPDDDEDPAVLAQYRFMLKATDKIKDELMYFYDPTSLQGLVGKGGIFPAIGLVENYTKGLTNFMRNNWALIKGDEDAANDIKVMKYWMKSIPFANQMVGYLPMFYPELAKDLGVRIQSNYGIR